MTRKTKEVVLSPQKAVWKKDIKFDSKSLFQSLGKAATHIATLRLEELGDDTIDAIASLGLESTTEEIAYTLIRKSLFDALVSITKESLSHINQGLLEREDLIEGINSSLDGASLYLDRDFFNNPARSVFLTQMSKLYSSWLMKVGVDQKASEAIAHRLGYYFTFSISNEWNKNPEKYQALLEPDNPFSFAEEAESGWRLYFSHLSQKVFESVFDEPFGLSQIYIPLNAYYIEQKTEAKSKGFSDKKKRVCVKLEEELISWIEKKDKNDALRVISGGPGSGKSSFAKIFCCELAKSGLAKPIYIPLHLIDPSRDVVQEIERFVKDEGLLGFKPLDGDRKDDNILIVFDGLDELASMGKAAAQVARDFVQAVERMVERRNLGSFPIFVLLSGRELIVQENETEFRRPKQVLTILPYYVKEDRSKYEDPKKILEHDLRQIWWKKYGELTGSSFVGLPKELQLSEIDEITAQPLLNYLVALSYKRGTLDFSGPLNLNSVYADLVAAVHDRAYEKTRTLRSIRHLKVEDFFRVLEEIALAAWHGSDGRSTSIRDIMAQCKQSGLEPLLESFREGAQQGVTKLLAAFFFRRNSENVGDDASFVFTHKSFGEYLTARRIVRALERMLDERQRRRDNVDAGFDISDALLFWLKITGPAPITEYIHVFLIREISGRDKNLLERWHSQLVELAIFSMEKFMPVDKLGNLDFRESMRYNENSLVALMVALNSCSVTLKRKAELKFSTPTSLGSFLRKVCPQREGPRNPMLYSVLSYLDVTGQCLDMVDFYGANLEQTTWRECSFHFSNFNTAVLRNADFLNSYMNYSRFESANMNSTSFRDSRMVESIFRFANIVNADFMQADLFAADFSDASLRKCNFNKADISGSNFDEAREVNNCSFDLSYVNKKDSSLKGWLDRCKHLSINRGEYIQRDEKEERSVRFKRRRQVL